MRETPDEKPGNGRLRRLLAHEGNLQQELSRADQGDSRRLIELTRRLVRTSKAIRQALATGG